MRLESKLDVLYAERFDQNERAAKSRLWSTLCAVFFSRYVRPDATVLDLGAGYCDFVNHVRAARRIAVDLNPDTARFAASDVVVHQADLDRLAEVIEPSSVDVAFASNVFEHLRSPEALLAVLASVRSVVAPGGSLIVLQPNVRLVGGRFWDFFDHTLPLSEKGMQEALRISGFDPTETRARFLPYTTKSVLPQWPWLVRLYLLFRPAQWLFGKQMFIVARRRE